MSHWAMSQMFEEFPGRMRGVGGTLAAKFGRKVFDGVVEGGVGVGAGEQGEKVFF